MTTPRANAPLEPAALVTAAATCPMIAWGQDGRVLAASPALAELLGAAAADLVGRPLLQLTAQGQRQREVDLLAREVTSYCKELVRADGTSVAVRVIGQWRCPGAHVAVLTAVGMEEAGRDSRAIERDLRRQRALLTLSVDPVLGAGDRAAAARAITEVAAAGLGCERASVWLLDPSERRLECLDLWQGSLRSHQGGLALVASDFPEYFEAVAADRVIVAADALTHPATRALGPSYLVPFGIGSMLDAPIRLHGRVVGVLCHEHVGWPRRFSEEQQSFAASLAELVARALEADQRRRAEEELRVAGGELERRVAMRTRDLHAATVLARERETRMRSIIETIADGMVVVDDVGLIESCNPAFEHMFGASAAALRGRRLSSVIVGLPYPLRPSRLLAATEDLQGRRVDDGREFPVALTAGAMRLGARTLVTALVRDVTQRSRAKSELCQARDRAEAAVRAKSEFLATMSHEIRTPLNGVIGLTSLLLDSQLTDDQQGLAEGIGRSAHALLATINDILDLSKIEAGKLDLAPAPTDVVRLCAEVVELLAPAAHARGVVPRVVVAEGMPAALRVDPRCVRQVLMNLVGNAVKFTEAGHIEVRLALQADGGGTLRVEVEDTGPGVPPAAAGRLFQAFEQVDGSPARRHGGTGLGLAICRRLVELLDGRIGHRARPGGGAVFWFELPRVRTPLGASPVPRDESAQALRAPARERRGLRVLLAEDNRTNQFVARRMLERLGCEVVFALDGEEAVAAWGGAPLDLVLMDCHMPGVDGLEATRRIRAREREQRGRRTPIVALTAAALDEDREACKQAGMDDHLAKPFSFKALDDVLRRWTGTTSAA